MVPKYISLKEQIKEDIISNRYPLFSKLPTEVEMAKLYSVSRSTVRQALALLEKENIIEKKWGSGNTVISTGLSSFKDTVALLLPYDTEYRYQAISGDCSSLLYRNSLKIKVFATANLLDQERSALNDILNDSYAGVIAEPVRSALPSANLDLYRQIGRMRLPLVLIYSGLSDSLAAPSVTADDYSAGYTLTRHLINKGHRMIGGIFKCDEAPGVLRYSGYAEALRDAGLSIPEEHVYFYTTRTVRSGEGPVKYINTFINESIRDVTGMVCYNDQTAYLLIEALQQLGLSVPEDIAVTGIDDDYYASASTPPITTLALTRSIGREAANLIIQQRSGASARSVKIPWKLIQREST